MIKSAHITTLFISSLLFAAVSCDLFSGSDSLPGDLDHTLEKTGVDFSYQLLEPFDLSDGEDAHLKGLITIDDFEEGESAKSVSMYLYTLRVASKDLYLNLRDDPVHIYEINLEDLEIISRGQLPGSKVPAWGITRVVTIPLTEIVENLPVDLTAEQFSASDNLNIQWKVSLDDGRKTTRPCPWGMVYAGLLPPFCSSLYIQYYPPEDAFTGLHSLILLQYQ